MFGLKLYFCLVLLLSGIFCATDTDSTTSDGNGASTYQSKGTATSGELVFKDCSAVLAWTIATDSVTFTVTMTAKQWFGLGFGKGMRNIDMFATQIKDDNTVEVLDLWSTGNSLPETDSNSAYTAGASSPTADGYTITFTRKLDTGDATQDSKLTVGSDYEWGWGCKTGEKIMANQHNKVGEIALTFGKDGVTSSNFAQLILTLTLSLLISI